jgi:hypothetical protein
MAITKQTTKTKSSGGIRKKFAIRGSKVGSPGNVVPPQEHLNNNDQEIRTESIGLGVGGIH